MMRFTLLWSALLAAALHGQVESTGRLPHPAARTPTVRDVQGVSARDHHPDARTVAVPRLPTDPRAQLDGLLRDLAERPLTPEQVVALGRFAGVLDAETRASMRARLQRIADGIDPGAARPAPSAPFASVAPAHRMLQACLIAESLVVLGPKPDAGTLLAALESDDLDLQLAALHRIADMPAVAVGLQPQLMRLAEPGRFERSWTVYDVAIQTAAWRALLASASDAALRTRAIGELLDHGERADRVDALRVASHQDAIPQPLLRRIVHRLRAPDDDEVAAALTALAALGLPPKSAWRDRAYYFHVVGTAEDPAARLVARTELSWRGPWLDAALPRVAALAADQERPGVARLAAAVHEQLAGQLESGR